MQPRGREPSLELEHPVLAGWMGSQELGLEFGVASEA